MKLTFNNTKVLEEIDGEWYIMELDDGSIFNRKHVFSWLDKYKAYRLSPKELEDIQRSNIFKNNLPMTFVCGLTVFLGQTTKKWLPYISIKTSYPIKVLLLILTFFLSWLLTKKGSIWDKKKLDRILKKEIIWDTEISVHFFSKKDRIKYILFLTFTRLTVIVISFIFGIILFLTTDLLLGLMMSNVMLLVMLLPNRLPKRFYYTCEKLMKDKEDVSL